MAQKKEFKIFSILSFLFDKGRALVNFITSNPKITTFTSLVIFLLALRLIHSELNQFALEDIATAFDDVRLSQTLLAFLGAVISYIALCFNDRFCLSMIGKKLIYWRTIRASIASYSLAKTLGYSWAIASTARARFYSRWGLSNAETGALSMSTGVAVQIGGLSAAGFGLLLGANEIARHGPFDAYFWWILCLVAFAPAAIWLYYCDYGPSYLKWGAAKLHKPTTKIAAAHLGVIIFDKIGAALCLYMLLPEHGGWGFPSFLAVFILAGLLGAISGAPGGLGVFEAAILTMAPNSQNIPGAAVALLVYRIFYNIIPMVAATIFLGIHHAAPVAKPAVRAARKVSNIAFDVAPQILALLVFISGYILIAASATPSFNQRMIKLEALLDPVLIDIAHFCASFIGIALMLNANFLWRESKFGLYQSWGLIGLGIIFSLIKGISWEIALGLTIVLVLLFSVKNEFQMSGDTLKRGFSYRFIAAIIGSLATMIWLSYFSYNQTPYSHSLWFETGAEANVARAFRAIMGAIIYFIFAIFINWLMNTKSDED